MWIVVKTAVTVILKKRCEAGWSLQAVVIFLNFIGAYSRQVGSSVTREQGKAQSAMRLIKVHISHPWTAGDRSVDEENGASILANEEVSISTARPGVILTSFARTYGGMNASGKTMVLLRRRLPSVCSNYVWQSALLLQLDHRKSVVLPYLLELSEVIAL